MQIAGSYWNVWKCCIPAICRFKLAIPICSPVTSNYTGAVHHPGDGRFWHDIPMFPCFMAVATQQNRSKILLKSMEVTTVSITWLYFFCFSPFRSPKSPSLRFRPGNSLPKQLPNSVHYHITSVDLSQRLYFWEYRGFPKSWIPKPWLFMGKWSSMTWMIWGTPIAPERLVGTMQAERNVGVLHHVAAPHHDRTGKVVNLEIWVEYHL